MDRLVQLLRGYCVAAPLAIAALGGCSSPSDEAATCNLERPGLLAPAPDARLISAEEDANALLEVNSTEEFRPIPLPPVNEPAVRLAMRAPSLPPRLADEFEILALPARPGAARDESIATVRRLPPIETPLETPVETPLDLHAVIRLPDANEVSEWPNPLRDGTLQDGTAALQQNDAVIDNPYAPYAAPEVAGSATSPEADVLAEEPARPTPLPPVHAEVADERLAVESAPEEPTPAQVPAPAAEERAAGADSQSSIEPATVADSPLPSAADAPTTQPAYDSGQPADDAGLQLPPPVSEWREPLATGSSASPANVVTNSREEQKVTPLPQLVGPATSEAAGDAALTDAAASDDSARESAERPLASAPAVEPPQSADSPALSATLPPVVEAPTASAAPSSETRRAMRAVTEQALTHVRRGIALAGRGAHFAARAEFIQSLRVLSQSLDALEGNTTHTAALSAGMRALDESDDFVPGGSRLEADLDLPSIVAAHRTPVLKTEPAATLSPLVARQRYYTYAQEQLALSAGRERVGSMALFGLAKIRSTLADQNPLQDLTGRPKAMAFHQAALLVDAENYMAANELGVLLAKYGQYEQARAMLEYSLRITRQQSSWHNLAVVYDHLRQPALAQQARREAESLAGSATSPEAHLGVVWTDPNEFTRQSVRRTTLDTRGAVKTELK